VRDKAEGAMLAEELLGVFHKSYGTSWGPLLAHQLRIALRTVMTVGGTLRDVYGLFVDDERRAQIVTRLRDFDLRTFWTKEFPTIPAMRRSAVTNKLAPVVFHPILGQMLCAQGCAVDFDALLASRGSLIVNLSSGSPTDDAAALLGTFLVRKIMAAAFRQTAVPCEHRIPHVLVVDEFNGSCTSPRGSTKCLRRQENIGYLWWSQTSLLSNSRIKCERRSSGTSAA
jgi:hypothetical protein